jgi:hypothetical protein
MGRIRKYDYVLIKRLAKRVKDKNVTKITEKYCEAIGEEYSESKRKTVNRIILDLNLKSSVKKVENSKVYKDAQTKKLNNNKKNYLITYAQSNTPIYKSLWENMKAYAKEVDAEIIVIPGTYHNQHSEYPEYVTGWVEELGEFMFAGHSKLNNNLTIISDANVLPTAAMPLSGFEGITGEESSIMGHPRQHMQVVPTLPTSRDKIMATTGSITKPNYRKAKVGKKAEFNHVSGFLFVEIFDKEDYIFRHVSAKSDGSFQDLFYLAKNGKVNKSGTWDSLILGDLHLGHEDKEMLNETFRLANIGNPKYIVTHDIFDGKSINHHEKKDFVTQVINDRKGISLDKELNYMGKWVLDHQSKKWKLVIIPSNHNDWLDKWVRLGGGEKDIKNAMLFNEFRKILFEERAPHGLVAHYLNNEVGDVITLGRHDSFKRKGFELNNHGDLGSNGARGTANTFKKLNVKLVSGDKHFLYTIDGARGVGISTTKFMGYNQGLSSWTKSHGVVNSLGKFQHLIYVKGKFTNLF